METFNRFFFKFLRSSLEMCLISFQYIHISLSLFFQKRRKGREEGRAGEAGKRKKWEGRKQRFSFENYPGYFSSSTFLYTSLDNHNKVKTGSSCFTRASNFFRLPRFQDMRGKSRVMLGDSRKNTGCLTQMCDLL